MLTFIQASGTGERSDGKYIDVEGAGILFLAWRCLYAETVRARANNESLKLKHAYARVVLMSISRLKTHKKHKARSGIDGIVVEREGSASIR